MARNLCSLGFLLALALPAQSLARSADLVPQLRLHSETDPSLEPGSLADPGLANRTFWAGVGGAMGYGAGHYHVGARASARNWLFVDLGLAGLGGLAFLVATGLNPDLGWNERHFIAFLPLVAWGVTLVVLRVVEVLSAVRAADHGVYHGHVDDSAGAW